MSWFSILPEGIQFIETWAIRIFLLLGTIAIGPWLLLIVYDFILYLFRALTYDIPVIGGRARNRPRPRAPSLTERSSGRHRNISTIVPEAELAARGMEEVAAEVLEGMKRRPERPGHKKEGSSAVIDD